MAEDNCKTPLRIYAMAFFTAIYLFVLTALWVPVTWDFVAHSSAAYYRAHLYPQIKPRSLTGTIAYMMGLSPAGFIALLQTFKLAWLTLLCFELFRRIQDGYIAFFLCALFAFSSVIYLANAQGGFVDIATHFWLLLGATLIIELARKPSSLWLPVAWLPLFFAVLTHEIAVFGCSLILLWTVLLHRRIAFMIVAPWLLYTGFYMGTIWFRAVYGDTPYNYTQLFLIQAQPVLHADLSVLKLNLIGIFTAAGMLWPVYIATAIHIIRRQPDPSLRLRYSLFCLAGVVTSLAPLLMGTDTQRMTNGLWLPLYMLLIDQAKTFNDRAASTGTHVKWSLLCAAQFLIPPFFIVAQTIRPLNAYAAYWLAFITH